MTRLDAHDATVARLMELVHTLPPRSLRPLRDEYLAEIEAIARSLRDGVTLPGVFGNPLVQAALADGVPEVPRG